MSASNRRKINLFIVKSVLTIYFFNCIINKGESMMKKQKKCENCKYIQKKLPKNDEKRIRKAFIFSIGIIFSLIGFVLYLIACFIIKDYSDIWANIASNLGLAMIPLGIISVVYSFFDKIYYTENKIIDAIFNNEAYLKFSEARQLKIKTDIEENLLEREIGKSNTLYSTIHNEIIPLCKKIFFSERNIKIKVKFNENTIRKEVQDIMQIERFALKKQVPTTKIKLSNFIGSHYFTKDGDKSIKSVIIDCKNNHINKYALNKNTAVNESFLDNKFTESFNLTCDDEIELLDDCKKRIEVNYITEVPLEDKTFGIRLRYPCQNLHIEVDLQTDIIECFVFGFSFMSSVDKENLLINKDEENKIKIDFNKWMLPGDGFTLFFEPKK